ncbi:MAG: hypothetical protein JWR50_4363 [Mucilaginibacter sp.]|nr:hypothetical protein [Mucilaginibacter sp.]
MKRLSIILLILVFVSLLILKTLQDRGAGQIAETSTENINGTNKVRPIPVPKYNSNGAFILGSRVPAESVSISQEQIEKEKESRATQLYQDLFTISANSTTLSQSQTEAVYRHARELADTGSLGLRAIGSLLQSTNSVRLTTTPGSTGLPTLRTLLIDSLGQMLGVEVVTLQRSLLKSTSDPLEIAMLGRNIDRQAPGEFGEELVMAASRQIDHFSSNPTAADVSSLFKILEKQITPETVTKVTPRMDQWQYYSAMALGYAPEGSGFSALVSKALAGGGSVGEKAFAWQMVGQTAMRSSVSSQSFMDTVGKGAVPDAAWPKIAEGIAGEQFSFAAPVTDPSPYAQKPGLKTYHIEDGNQNYYSLPAGTLSIDEIRGRLQMINQLLATGGSPAEIQALEAARNSLNQMQPRSAGN